MRLADGLARTLGAGAPALAAAVAAPPPGSEALLLKLLYACTERAPATPSLAAALLARHAAAPDARLLPPALGGLPKADALGLLPQILWLADRPLRAALHRYLLPKPGARWRRGARQGFGGRRDARPAPPAQAPRQPAMPPDPTSPSKPLGRH